MKYAAATDPADAAARYVHVDDAGAARELTTAECAYLATAFDPSDGDRPYIKERYASLTPDGMMHGFLEREQLPWRVARALSRAKPRGAPRPLSSRRRALRDAIVAILVALPIGYLAALMGAVLLASLVNLQLRPLAIILFVIGAGLGTVLLIGNTLALLFSGTRYRLLRFVVLLAVYLGALGAAAWVLWMHGDPARIVPWHAATAPI